MGSYRLLDTDKLIEEASGKTIPEIFEEESEDGFRDIESKILDSVHPFIRCVISTGGGIVCRTTNWAKLHTGLVIWIDVAPETIIKRIHGTDRPLLQTEDPLQTLKNIFEERKEQYMEADLRIEISDETPDQAADLVIRALHDFIDDHPPRKIAAASTQT